MDRSIPVVIQARLGSSRLPRKMLVPLGGVTAIERVVHAAQLFSDQVVIATTLEPKDDELVAHAADLGVDCIRGPEHDVLRRFQLALGLFPRAEWVYRVTGDCPLLAPALASTLARARSDAWDYIYLADDELPRGLAPELVRTKALRALDPASLTAAEREHVTLAWYSEPRSNRALKCPVPREFAHPQFRLTLDYPEDAALFQELYARSPTISPEAALLLLASDPELSALNAACLTAAPHLEVANLNGRMEPAA